MVPSRHTAGVTATDHEDTRSPTPSSHPATAEKTAPPVLSQPAPDASGTAPSHAELSSFTPHMMAGAGFIAMLVAMFAPLASSDDPATALRTTDLPFLTPMLGLVVLVVATGALCSDVRFLRFGRATAPLLGLLLSAAVGGEIFQWGAKAADPHPALADMVASGTYFLIGGVLLLSLSVLPMHPTTAHPAPPAA